MFQNDTMQKQLNKSFVKNSTTLPKKMQTSPQQWAIGDIHGCYDTFCALLEQLQLQQTDQLFLLGDYINRGNNSKLVLDKIMELSQKGYQIFPLRGNHEQMLLDAYQQGEEFLDLFFYHYNSFDLKVANLAKYLNFCDGLSYYYALDKFYLSHAGFNFAAENPFTAYRYMYANMRVRGSDKYLKDKHLVHGHTPQSEEEIRTKVENRNALICLDNGCVYNDQHHKGLGKLFAFNLATFELRFEQNTEIIQRKRQEEED